MWVLTVLCETYSSFAISGIGNKVQLGAVGRGVLWAGGIFGAIGALIPWPIICPNCTG